MYFNVSKYTSMFGAAAAAEKKLVETEGLDCDFQLTRSLDVYLDPKHARETEMAWKTLASDGVVDLSDVAFISKNDAERVSNTYL
jgi:hypothetical protein